MCGRDEINCVKGGGGGKGHTRGGSGIIDGSK